MPKLTKAWLLKLGPGDIARDSSTPGFFAEAGRARPPHPPRIALRAQTDLKGPPVRTRKVTFGHWPELSIDDARNRAMAWIARIRQGHDPSAPEASAKAARGPLTVAAMFDRAREHLVAKGRAERTVADLVWLEKKYLPHWAGRVAADVKPSELRAEHERITREHGPVAANKAARAFRLAYNVALKQSDETLPSNPVRGVNFHRQRARDAVLMPEDLADWYQRLQTCPNPLRRLMHELALFSALRPGVVVAIDKSWLDLSARAIMVPGPKQKARREFHLPMSEHMVKICRIALALSDQFHSGGPWLWPTQGKGGAWQATTVWRESKLVGETGHILRATWRTQAKACGADDMLAGRIMDHAGEGMKPVYIRDGLWPQLLETQERVTAHLLRLIASK